MTLSYGEILYLSALSLGVGFVLGMFFTSWAFDCKRERERARRREKREADNEA